ncbi:VWA domain-containing protein [Cupriavidus sp. 30B13]|uniref:VWA domain-containing protein n=1 Tax=Cupriavidus sp. 30B13 TaxID=3384241 RepID=UPI003B8F01CC
MDFAAFHFLRPAWLLLVPAAAAIAFAWHRLSDPRRRWQGVIAPHLLARLIVDNGRAWRLRPVHGACVALALTGLAAAGPAWEREPPPFTEDKAPLVVAIDLSRSMDAVDVAPTRLERAKQKVRDLMALRAGARTGLVVYAGTAHMVVPPTDDPAFMELFLAALDTGMMPAAGKNAAAALALADGLLGRESAAGTVLLVTDGFERAQIPAFAAHARASRVQVLALAAGTARGGPVRTSDGRVATDQQGRPVQGTLDLAALQALSSQADVPLASLTLDDDDVRWVQRRAVRNMEAAQEKNAEVRWKEAGYPLVVPVAVLAVLWFRRGWVVRWLPLWLAALAGLLAPPPRPAQAAESRVAGAVANAFLTPDQQGRRRFGQGDFAGAAAHFQDPMWRGWASYRAGDYAAALTAFASLDTPDAFFMMGNCYARLRDYPRALAAYDNALRGRPAFAQASANRALVAALLARQKKDEDDGEQAPALPPDKVEFDDKDHGGKQGKLDMSQLQRQNAELWMRNLQVSPADFLRQKFLIEARQPAPASAPASAAAARGAAP